MRKILGLLSFLLCLTLCAGAQADWVCQQRSMDGAVCGTVNEDGSGYCSWCGFEEPVHGLTATRSGLDFIKLKWYGVNKAAGGQDGPMLLYWCVSGTGKWRAIKEITGNSYLLEGLEPGKAYDIQLATEDDEVLDQITASTESNETVGNGSGPVAAVANVTEAPTSTSTPAPEVEIPGGRYTVGTDIPAGAYVITIKKGSTCLTVWGKAYNDYSSDGGMLMCVALFEDENPTLGKVVLKKGTVISFDAALCFAQYTGISFDPNATNILPGGRYTVGEDIPAGSYTVTIRTSSTCLNVWGKEENDYNAGGGLLLNVALFSDENPTLGKVVLEEGNVVAFDAELEFSPYQGFSF